MGRQFEKMDPGYNTYSGFLHMEASNYRFIINTVYVHQITYSINKLYEFLNGSKLKLKKIWMPCHARNIISLKGNFNNCIKVN